MNHPLQSHASPIRRRTLARLRAAAAGALLALAPLAVAAQDPVGACPTPEEQEVARLINVERARVGLAPVSLDVRLVAASVRHSEDLLDGCFLSHTGSDGTLPWHRMQAASYPSAWSGEVAGAGQRTPEEIVAGWMASPGHHAIIMSSSARHIGVGHAQTEAPCLLRGYSFQVADFWTSNLGGDRAAAASPADYCGDAAPAAACADGIDNDGDGALDYGADFGCVAADDASEEVACSDGIDNDGDLLVDHPDDPECLSPDQWSESFPSCGLGFEVAPALLVAGRLRRRRARVAPARELAPE